MLSLASLSPLSCHTREIKAVERRQRDPATKIGEISERRKRGGGENAREAAERRQRGDREAAERFDFGDKFYERFNRALRELKMRILSNHQNQMTIELDLHTGRGPPAKKLKNQAHHPSQVPTTNNSEPRTTGYLPTPSYISQTVVSRNFWTCHFSIALHWQRTQQERDDALRARSPQKCIQGP